MDTQLLIASAPAELLLGLGILICTTGLLLLLLSAESGNYPEFSYLWRTFRNSLYRRRPRRRWHFNTAGGFGNKNAGIS